MASKMINCKNGLMAKVYDLIKPTNQPQKSKFWGANYFTLSSRTMDQIGLTFSQLIFLSFESTSKEDSASYGGHLFIPWPILAAILNCLEIAISQQM